ncbi:MAG: ribbon-helix-helix domain-containing protein [Candidatus Dormibacteria bacterium]
MRRTQIYLEERQLADLNRTARAHRRTVSEIIREAIDEKFATPEEVDRFERTLAAAAGIWADRTDLGSTDDYVRRTRRDRRRVSTPRIVRPAR